jgi:predicted ribosome quality control (RQC) complex YloA/Tae2 family protein
MISSWFVLEKLRDVLQRELINRRIDSLFTINKNELILCCEADDSTGLIIQTGGPTPYLLVQTVHKPKKSVQIFPQLNGAIIQQIELAPADRTFIFRFAPQSRLFIELRSPRGNVWLETGGEFFSFKKSRHPFYSPSMAPLSVDKLEDDPRFNRYWRKHLPELFPDLDYHAIIHALRAANGQSIGGRFVLLPEKNEVYSPDRFYQNYLDFIKKQAREMDFGRQKEELFSRLNRKAEQFKRIIFQLENSEPDKAKAEIIRYEADMLAAFQFQIDAGTTRFAIPEAYQLPEMPKEIQLNPALSIQQQIEAKYRRARNFTNEKTARKEKLIKTKSEYEKIRILTAALEKITDIHAIRQFHKENSDFFEQIGRDNKGDESAFPYSKHDFQGWEIWVGKSAKDNDEMTFHHSAKNDLWLHTRHSSGSHVIIRAQGKKAVPPEILRYAAALAARYSKEKHSGLVSVVYTLRKYVTKRKGAPPGKVTYQFEKEMLIEPRRI